MNIQNLIKNILINEVGEGTHKPFRTKIDTNRYPNKYRASKEKDDFSYEFKTEKGFKYSVDLTRQMGQKIDFFWNDEDTQESNDKQELADFYKRNRAVYVNLKKMGAKKEDFLSIWQVSFQVDEAPEEYFKKQDEEEMKKTGTPEEPIFDNSEDVDYPTPQSPSYHPTYRFISTGSNINHGEFFRVMATVSKIIKNHIKRHKGKIVSFSPADERRGRIFTRYILTQIPGTKSYVNNNDFYFLINV